MQITCRYQICFGDIHEYHRVLLIEADNRLNWYQVSFIDLKRAARLNIPALVNSVSLGSKKGSLNRHLNVPVDRVLKLASPKRSADLLALGEVR